MVEAEGLSTVLLETLGIEQERAIKLLEKIEDLAMRHGHPRFLIEDWEELFKMAETAEEAFFVGFAATLLADSMAMVTNPIKFITTSIATVENVKQRVAERRRTAIKRNGQG